MVCLGRYSLLNELGYIEQRALFHLDIGYNKVILKINYLYKIG
jgi:hypothetical protein